MGNILQEVQNYVVGKLSADNQLSGNCTFLAENRKDIDYEIKNALGRQGIVGVVMTPRAIYAGKYEDLFLAWTLEELEIDIVENPVVNRGKKTGYMTGQDIGMRVFDVLCPLSGDYEGQFNPQTIEEGEDNGLIVNRCILKALVYGEHGDTPQPEPGLNMQFVKLLDGPPSKPPHDGWMWPQDDGFVIWQNGQQHVLGNLTFNAMSAYVSQQLSSYLPAEIYGSHDEYATVKKIIEIHDERPDSYNEPVLTLAQNNSNRSFEIINTSSLATLNFGVLSSGVPKISFGIDDPETFNTVYFQNKSGTVAYQSDLSAYLPLSGGTITGYLSVGNQIVFEYDLGGGHMILTDGQGQNSTCYQRTLIATPYGNLYFPVDIPEQEQYLAIRSDLSSYLNLSGGTMSGDIDMGGQHGAQPMNSEFLKFMEYYFGYAELGSGFGIYHRDEGSGIRYPAYLFNENKWETQYDVIRRGDLSRYLPLSGGTLCGSIEIPTQYRLSVGQYQLQDKDFDGFQIGDGYDFWKFGGSSEQPNDVMRRTDISAFPTTDEISATRVETMTTIHESDWADISASASSSTLYIVIPD